MSEKIKNCRICGNSKLDLVLDLGEQYLTGVFPKTKEQKITKGPLRLVKCSQESKEACGLLQLENSYDSDEMYGDNYGYRSGLNQSMVQHLHRSVGKIIELARPQVDDLIVDIGSNDSTLLQGYPSDFKNLVGIDPTGKKFFSYYPKHIKLIPSYFSAERISHTYPSKKAKVISSFSMFYDLERPMDFVREIESLLEDNGIWAFEQSYMPTMLEKVSYDTVCHEHLEYYGLHQIKWMLDRAGLKIIDFTFNDINGGSICIFAAKKKSSLNECSEKLNQTLEKEVNLGLTELSPYLEFSDRVKKIKKELVDLLKSLKSEGKKVIAAGASTKGNVILQYCNIDSALISEVAEVNDEKFGSYTPGTLIPIVSEESVKNKSVQYKLILPWHFKETFLKKEKEFMLNGGKLIFPFPEVTLIGKENL